MATSSGQGSLPVDAREALQWFVNNFGLYIGSSRGLFIGDWGDEREATLEAAIINLKSRGLGPLVVTGHTLYTQADYLWKESRSHTQFGRPLASKLELELSGSDVVVVDNLEAPENSRHLWYLYSQLLYPRAVAGKATVITTPLSLAEFLRYGASCNDPDFLGKPLNWEKLGFLMQACLVTLDQFKLAREEGLPPMLKAEYELYGALKQRGMDVVPQHALGDYMLDFAILEKEHRLAIECDTLAVLGGNEIQREETKRNFVLFSDGWQVLKFSSAEILGNKTACVDTVEEVWRNGRKRGAVGCLLTGNSVVKMPDLPVEDETEISAITYGGGPAAVCGGAGTGKTTCVVQRVAYLIAKGISPESILVVTHSSDTQRSLKRAIELELEDKPSFQKLNIYCWQDLGLKILKENLPLIRRKPPLKVEGSPQKVIQRLLSKLKKEVDPTKLELCADLDEFYIAAVIAMYKAHLLSANQAKEDANSFEEEIISKIYQQLEDQLQKANKIDREDVITLTVQVLLEHPEVRARYQGQCEYLLVDEYQDVTVAQDMLARILAAPQDNLFMVGDEDETIAEGKNACPELFVETSLRMPHSRCYILERNWRSHPAIVDHARQLMMAVSRRKIAREFFSAWGQAPPGAIIGPAILADEFDEANWVANEIQLLVDSGSRSYGDIAILFRHHVYATILEEALERAGVHYQSSNPINNFIPDEVEDMLAFLKLVVDPDGPKARDSFERICQLRVREIDPKLSGTIAGFAEANNLSYLKAVEIYADSTGDYACGELRQLVRIIRTMNEDKNEIPPYEMIRLIRNNANFRLNDYYQQVKVPAGVNYEPLKKLRQFEEESRRFSKITEFVQHVIGQRPSGGGINQGVQVLPILESKGAEYPVVFMVGMAEGIFPAETALDLEEERRICYVGLTRAKENVYLSVPQMFSGALLQPSRFLVEARLMAAPLAPSALSAAQPQTRQTPVPTAFAPAALPVQPVVHKPSQQPIQQPVQPVQPLVQPIQPPPQPVPQQPVRPAAQAPVSPTPMPGQRPGQPAVSSPLPQPVQPPAQPVQQPARPATQGPALSSPLQQSPPEPPPLPEPQIRPVRPPAAAQVPAAPQAPPTQPQPESFPLPSVPTQPVQPAAARATQQQEAFQVYTADTMSGPTDMPSLPKSKNAPAASAKPAAAKPAEQVPGEWIAPVIPQSLSDQLFQQMAQGQVEHTQVPGVTPMAQHPAPTPPTFAQHYPGQQAPQVYDYAAAHPQMFAEMSPRAVAPGHPVCPSCHAALEGNARFCSECGYSLPARVPACPTCNAPLEITAKFCGECGMSLNVPLAGDSSHVSQSMHRMQELKDKQHGWVNKIWKMLES